MVKSVVCVVFVSGCLLGLISNVWSLRCYNCTQLNKPECRDPFTKQRLFEVSCPPNKVCVKHKRPALLNIPKFIQRGCVDEGYCKTMQHDSLHCSECKTDKCNTSATISPSCILLSSILFKIFSFI